MFPIPNGKLSILELFKSMELLQRIDSKLTDNLRFRAVLVLCCLLLIIIREPALLIHPRLWAEEGCIFYQFARHHSLYEIFTTVHVGYLTLFNSMVSAMQAKVFSVESAPVVSTYAGFIIQLIPVYIIIFTTHSFWDTAFKKIICVLVVIVFMAPEIWLNTTNSHFIFGLITFLIMTISANEISVIQKHLFRVLLFIGGLTGPASILFTPVFIAKAYKEKSREKIIQAGILTACAITQSLIIMYAILYNNTYHRLSTHNYRKTIYYFFVDNFSMLPYTSTSYLHPVIFYLSLSFGVLMFAFWMYLLVNNKKEGDYLISLSSIILVGTFSTLGSLNMEGSPRYSYIPSCIFIIVIISEVFKIKTTPTKMKYVASCILIACLLTNIIYYKHGMLNTYQSTFPKWKEEVSKWRVDSTYCPKVHPGLDPGQCKL